MRIDFKINGWAQRAVKGFINTLPRLKKDKPVGGPITGDMLRKAVQDLPVYSQTVGEDGSMTAGVEYPVITPDDHATKG
jgi:hypothetical protein